MIRTVGILSKPRPQEVYSTVPALVAWLRGRGIHVLLDPESAGCLESPPEARPREEIPESADLLIVLGGDGTVLAAARLLERKDVPILGVNLGGLGFLTSVTREELYSVLEQVLAGKYSTSDRMMLEAQVYRGGKVIEQQTALNDAVMNQAALARLMDFDVTVNGNFVGHYRADGIIIATPTGSTAYSLAAGGPVVHPEVRAFVITPICPHMLTNRPLVLPEASRVEIEFTAGEETVHLTMDGQIGFGLKTGDYIAVSRASRPARLVMPAGKTHFEVLRNKLRWGER
jgi:NAD+ kinase